MKKTTRVDATISF